MSHLVAGIRRWYWAVMRGYEYEICHTCGRPVGRCTGSWWRADDSLWLEITGREEGVLCPPCFTDACRVNGVFVFWAPVVDSRAER